MCSNDNDNQEDKKTSASADVSSSLSSQENPIAVPAFLLKPGIAIGQYVTVQRASEIYSIPKWKFYECIRRRLLRAYHVLNSRIYLRLSDVENLLQQSA